MKRGVIPVWFSFIISAIVVILVLMFYFLFLKGDRAPQQVHVELSTTPLGGAVLNQYLAAPVNVEGTQMTFAELLRLWYRSSRDKKYEDVLVPETRDFFSRASVQFIDKYGNQRTRIFRIAINVRDTPFGPGCPSAVIAYVPIDGKEALRVMGCSSIQ